MVGNRDVAAVVLFPACAGRGDPARNQRRPAFPSDSSDYELHQLGGTGESNPRDVIVGALAALCRSGTRVGRIAMAHYNAPCNPLRAGLRDRRRHAVDSRIYFGRERAVAAGPGNPGADTELGQPAESGRRPAEPGPLSMDPDSRHLHLPDGDGLQFSRRSPARPPRPVLVVLSAMRRLSDADFPPWSLLSTKQPQPRTVFRLGCRQGQELDLLGAVSLSRPRRESASGSMARPSKRGGGC